MALGSRKSQLLLAAVVALGVGGRMWRGRETAAAPSPESVAQLDTQLARVDSARARAKSGAGRSASRRASTSAGTGKGKGKGKTGSKGAGTSVGGEGGLIPLPSSGPRVESTPIGALDPAAAARTLAEDRVETGPKRADSKREDSSSPIVIVDIDRADARTIEALPRIDPALARRIVDDRAKRGPFGSLVQLQRVRGIGPALASQLEGRVTFGGTGRPSRAELPTERSARATDRRSRQRERPP